MLGNYKLNKDMRLQVGISSFDVKKDHPIEVIQTNAELGQILVKFDKRTCDWFSNSFLNNLEEIL